ncbi:hypothetical protein BSU01_14495 [Erwinia billingiae]|uniref:hypothetical protein n=1 Tax=Erwinia billingiae TaxID=182337 RepID=UPI0019D00D57|nr:hypothetical protein [Erwinia billingiae]MBN7122910.1 hypothetical protein [Erwinia billingiae]
MADTEGAVGKWAVVRSKDNVCINAILWDGSSDWIPPSDCYMVNLDGVDWYDIGAIYNKDTKLFTSMES